MELKSERRYRQYEIVDTWEVGTSWELKETFELPIVPGQDVLLQFIQIEIKGDVFISEIRLIFLKVAKYTPLLRSDDKPLSAARNLTIVFCSGELAGGFNLNEYRLGDVLLGMTVKSRWGGHVIIRYRLQLPLTEPPKVDE